MGSGIVNYFGNPVITSNISGSGKIVKPKQNIGSIFVEFTKTWNLNYNNR